MNSLWKRTLSAFLAMVMVFGMLPVPGYAEEVVEELSEVEEFVEEIAEESMEESEAEEYEAAEEIVEEVFEEEPVYEDSSEDEVVEEEVPEEELALSGDVRKIYFLNTESWEAVWAAWTFDEEAFADLEQPGVEMAADEVLENVYAVELPVEADAVVFSDGIELTEELLAAEEEAELEVVHEIQALLDAELDYFDASAEEDSQWQSYAALTQPQEVVEETPVAGVVTDNVGAVAVVTEDVAGEQVAGTVTDDVANEDAEARATPKGEWNADYSVYEHHGDVSLSDLQDAIKTWGNEENPTVATQVTVKTFWGGSTTFNFPVNWKLAAASKTPSITVSPSEYVHTGNYVAQATFTDAGIDAGRLGSGKGSPVYTHEFTLTIYDNLTVTTLKDDATSSPVTKIYRDGKAVTIEVPEYEGYDVKVDGASQNDQGVWVVAPNGLSGDKQVSLVYTKKEAAKYNVALTVVGDKYGDASLDVSGDLPANSPVVLTAVAKESGATDVVNYLKSVEIDGADWTETNKFVVGESDVIVTVTFAQEALPLNEEPYEIKINGFDNESVADGLKGYVLDAVIDGEYNPDDYLVEMMTFIDLVIWSGEIYFNVEGGELDLGRLGKHHIPGSWFVTQMVVDGETENNFKITKLANSNVTGVDLYKEDVMVVADEFRDEVTVTLPENKRDYTENTLDDVIAGIKANTLVNGKAVDASALTVTLDHQTPLSTTEQTYKVTITAAQTAEYLQSTSVEISVTADIKTYTVTWVADGVTVDTESVAYGSNATKTPTVPAKTGHTGTWSGSTESIKTDTTITAVYTANSYTVNWTVNGEAYGTPSSVPFGDSVTAPEYTVPAGYTFSGWTNIPATMPAENITLNATLTPIEYDVKWVWQNAEGEQTTTVTLPYGTDITVPAEIPTQYKVGNVTYTRTGWTGLTDGATVPVGGITYKATYTTATAWIVDFNSNGGSEVVDVTVIVPEGETKVVAKPADPTREGYRFECWELNGTEYDFDTPVTGDITLTAKWVKQVNVTFDIGEQEAYAKQTFDINTAMPEEKIPSNPTKEKAIFDGWYLGEDKYDFTTKVTEDITLTAKWLADVNENEVEDAKEIISIKVIGEGAITLSDNLIENPISTEDAKTYVFDSKNPTITITATPVVEQMAIEGETKPVSTTYVASIGDAELSYDNNFVATAELTVEDGDKITVTFEKAEFTYDEDGEMRFYVGMEDPDYETLYKAVIKNPAYDATEGVISAKYLARPAATYQMQVPVLFEYTIPLINYTIKIGGNNVDLDLEDAWLDVGQPFKTLTPEELQKQYDTEIQKIKDKIAAIDLTDISLSNAWDKVQQFTAISEELTKLIETISNEAKYLGYHQFGASGVVDENGNVQEKLQIIYQNNVMRLVNEELYVTLVDDRIGTTITAGDLTFEYDEFTDEDIMNALTLTDVNGNAIDGELVKYVDLTGTEVGSRTFSVYYEGSCDYKPCTVELTLNVVKAPSKVDVLNQNIDFGTEVSAPVITNKHGETIDVDAIEIILGLDVAELDIDGDGIKGLTGRAQLILTDDLQTILSMVGLENGVEMNISDLIKTLTNTGILEQWGVSGTVVDSLKKILDEINGIVETNNLMISVGGDYPEDAGAYLHAAVTVDKNYETAFDVGYILIKPVAERVYLNWNFNATDGVFTPSMLESMNLSATAYTEESFENPVAAATELINNLFFGVDANGEFVAELFNKEVTDPEELENKLSNGAYAQMAFIAEFGNKFYYSVPIVRAFAIMPDVFDVNLVGDDGTANREMLKTFNNEPKGFSVKVTDNSGKLIYSDHYQTNDVNELLNPVITYNYVGIQTNGQSYQSSEKPVHAGAYAVTVSVEDRDNDGNLLGFGADVGLLVIEPAESNVIVEDKIVKNENVLFRNLVTAESVGTNLKPDTTIITAGIDTNADINEKGWAAVNGVVNIDFPAWMDALLKQYVPSVVDGITASQLKEMLDNKLPDISTALTELGASNEVINALANLTENITKVLDEMPENIKLSFQDDAKANEIGTYIVVAIVTDSDHYPSVDAGYLVVLPDVTEVELKWNHEDENGIFTRDLLELEDVDLLAKAYTDGKEVEADITYQFISIDKNGKLVTYTNPETVPNGVYLEVAYIELYIDGDTIVGDMIARPVVIVASNSKVNFENVETVFDNTNHGVNVTITDLENREITVGEGEKAELTVLYAGLQTNGDPYLSEVAPTHAGVYEALATYVHYDANGELRYYGANAGYVMIDMAESQIAVTGDHITYDGYGHTADVSLSLNGDLINADYTLISGGISVSEDANEFALDAFNTNVNIDFPRWLENALKESGEFEFVDGVDVAYLVRFIKSYREGLIKVITVDKLVEWNIVTVEQQNAYKAKLNAYIDAVIATLEKMPQNVTLTFDNNKTYAAPGVYGYYGIITDSDHYPSTDTGLLVIDKAEITSDCVSVGTYVYDGTEQTAKMNIVVGNMELTPADYTVTGNKATNAGTYTATISGKGKFTGTVTVEWQILPAEIISVAVEGDYVYTGAEQTAKLVVKAGELELTADDYTVIGNTGTNATTYTAIITGKGNFTGNATVEWKILPAEITSVEVAGDYVYNGTEQTAKLVVKAGDMVVDAGDYKVTGNVGKNAGEYTISVTGINSFAGVVEAKWEIVPAEIILTVKDNEVLAGTTEIPAVVFEITNSKGEVKLDELEASAIWEVEDRNGKLVHGEYANGDVTYSKSENWIVTKIVDGKLTVKLENYVCWNPDTAQYWNDLPMALDTVDAPDSETIQMLKSVANVNYVIVAPGTTLDLNGLTVEAYLVSGFKGAHVIDSSENNAGLLMADMPANVRLDTNNEQIPAWNGAGYKFYTVNFNTRKTNPDSTDIDLFQFYMFRTDDWRELYTLFTDHGSDDLDLKLYVKLSYVTSDGIDAAVSYKYPETMTSKAASIQLGSETKVGIYKATTKGMNSREKITYSVVLVSGTGAEIEVIHIN